MTLAKGNLEKRYSNESNEEYVTFLKEILNPILMPPLTRKQKKINVLKAKRRSQRLNQLPPEEESKDEDKSE